LFLASKLTEGVNAESAGSLAQAVYRLSRAAQLGPTNRTGSVHDRVELAHSSACPIKKASASCSIKKASQYGRKRLTTLVHLNGRTGRLVRLGATPTSLSAILNERELACDISGTFGVHRKAECDYCAELRIGAAYTTLQFIGERVN